MDGEAGILSVFCPQMLEVILFYIYSILYYCHHLISSPRPWAVGCILPILHPYIFKYLVCIWVMYSTVNCWTHYESIYHWGRLNLSWFHINYNFYIFRVLYIRVSVQTIFNQDRLCMGRSLKISLEPQRLLQRKGTSSLKFHGENKHKSTLGFKVPSQSHSVLLYI